MGTITQREPVVLIGTIAAATIAVLQAVGNDFLPAGVSEEVIIIIQAIVAIVGIVAARARVTPV
jgi:hypothetical protein